MKKTAYHINEVLRIMDQAHRDHATVKLRAWTTDGRAIDYDGWLVSGGSWRGGFHRLTHPQTGEAHREYWDNLCNEEGIIDPVERMERIKEERDNIIFFVESI